MSVNVPPSSGLALKPPQDEETKVLHGALAGSGSWSDEALLGLVSGVVFGLVSPIVGHPFDSVKTRMQVDPAYRHSNAVQTVRSILRIDGVAGFYRGVLPPLVGSMAFRGLLFSAYSGTYAACEHVSILHEPIPYTYGLRPSVIVGALAASLARASIESPFDFIKVRYMIGQGAMHDAGSASVSQLLTSPIRSISHLYSGFGATFFRTFGLLGSFFVMVDYSVRYIPDVVNAPYYGTFFKGGVCATLGWCIAFPFESAKSVIQADTTGKYKNMRNATLSVMKQLYQQRGLSGLYRGFGPGASRSFIANGISMMCYAWIQDLIRRQKRS